MTVQVHRSAFIVESDACDRVSKDVSVLQQTRERYDYTEDDDGRIRQDGVSHMGTGLVMETSGTMG